MKLVFTLLLSVILLSADCQKVSGVITYYFNQYQGDKPDIGAHITIVDSTLLIVGFEDSCAIVHLAYMMRQTTHGPRAKMKKFDAFETKIINDSHVLPYILNDALYDSLDQKLMYSLVHIVMQNRDRSVVVDGSGNYSIPISSGCYYIIAQSNGRKSLPAIYAGGKLYIQKIHISDKDIVFNHKFDM